MGRVVVLSRFLFEVVLFVLCLYDYYRVVIFRVFVEGFLGFGVVYRLFYRFFYFGFFKFFLFDVFYREFVIVFVFF